VYNIESIHADMQRLEALRGLSYITNCDPEMKVAVG